MRRGTELFISPACYVKYVSPLRPIAEMQSEPDHQTIISYFVFFSPPRCLDVESGWRSVPSS